MKTAYVIFLLLDLLILAYAFKAIVQSPSTKQQKKLQFLLAALVPFVGPLLVIFVHRSDDKSAAMSDRYIGQSIDEASNDVIMMQGGADSPPSNQD
jgi:hypothetical protein